MTMETSDSQTPRAEAGTEEWHSLFMQRFPSRVIREQPFWRQVLVWNHQTVLNDVASQVTRLMTACLDSGGVAHPFVETAREVLGYSHEFEAQKIFLILASMAIVPTIKQFVDRLNGNDAPVQHIVDRYTSLVQDTGYMARFWVGAPDPCRLPGHWFRPGEDDGIPSLVHRTGPSSVDCAKWFFAQWPTLGLGKPGVHPSAGIGATSSAPRLGAPDFSGKDDHDHDRDHDDDDCDYGFGGKATPSDDNDDDFNNQTIADCVNMLAMVVDLSAIRSILRKTPYPRLPPQNSTAIIRTRGGSPETMFHSIDTFVRAFRMTVLQTVKDVTLPL